MAKKLITIKQAENLLIQASNYLISNGFLKLNKETGSYDNTEKVNSKLSSGLKNVIKQIRKLNEEIIEEVNELRWKNALSDATTKALLFEPDGKTYKFSAEGMIKFNNEVKELKKREVEIPTRLQEDETVDLDDYDTFIGIVIPEIVTV